MPWLSATTTVPRDFAEPYSDALLEAGALSVDVSDADAGTAGERAIFDERGGAPDPGRASESVSEILEPDKEI